MELIKQFGIEPQLLIAQVINFLIILFLLKKLLYKPVLDLLKNRKKTISEGLQKAEEGRLLLEKARKEEMEILQKAQEKASKIVDQAKTQAKEMVESAREEAKTETDRIMQEAKESIEKEAEKAENKIMSHVAQISAEMLKKVLSRNVNQKVQKEYTEIALKQLKKRAD